MQDLHYTAVHLLWMWKTVAKAVSVVHRAACEHIQKTHFFFLDKLLFLYTPFSHSGHPFSLFVLVSNY